MDLSRSRGYFLPVMAVSGEHLGHPAALDCGMNPNQFDMAAAVLQVGDAGHGRERGATDVRAVRVVTRW